MNTRINYTQVCAQLNAALLSKKLEQMSVQAPEKKRRKLADVLAPFLEKLRELRARGWSHEQLAQELTNAGLPVKPSSLREQLGSLKKRRRVRRTAAI
jgi:5'-deoxynucleotidase YfbR-like HD superfamily hydrolase